MKRLRGTIVALLSPLLLAATPSQLPGEPTQRHRPATKNDKTYAEHKAPTSPSPTPTLTPGESTRCQDGPSPQPTVTKHHEPTQQIASQDEKEAEPIRVALVDVNRDWIDESYALFNFLLVAVGVFQVCLLFRQNKTIGLALLSNRPILVVVDPKPKNRQMAPDPPLDSIFQVDFAIKNAGMLPAAIISAVGKFEPRPAGSLPTLGDYSDCNTLDLSQPVLIPHKGQKVTAVLWGGTLNVEQEPAAKRGEIKLVLYGRIQYRMLTSTEVYETPFLWNLDVYPSQQSSNREQLEMIGIFSRGPEKYNRQT